jgi:hypothetical protein
MGTIRHLPPSSEPGFSEGIKNWKKKRNILTEVFMGVLKWHKLKLVSIFPVVSPHKVSGWHPYSSIWYCGVNDLLVVHWYLIMALKSLWEHSLLEQKYRF